MSALDTIGVGGELAGPLPRPAELPTAPPAGGPPAGHAAHEPTSVVVLEEAWPAAKRRTGRVLVPRSVRRMTGPLLLLALWFLVTATGLVSARTLANPIDVAKAFWELAETGELTRHLWVSLKRVVVGLALGVSSGVALAVLAGLFRLGDDIVDSAVQMLRTVPVLGLVPLFMVWFGIGEEPKIALITIGTLFPVYVNTYAGIRGVDAKLVEAATTFGVGRWGLIRQVILPGALPNFLVGLRFSLTASWLILIVAEQLNTREGLGYLVNEARVWFRTDIIVLTLVIYAVIGLALDGGVRLLERRLLAWRRGFAAR
ncbi:MAG TPA: ABC transporter permease [Ilumatobacter sp.]|nr:ABC transporter permease [Ilumatobacter sp.]